MTKYSRTPAGGEVVVSAAADETGGFKIEVRDNGIGIASSDIEKVLEPFTQVESSASRRHDGTGLGLPLSKSLVEVHGGEFSLESRPGQGTVVRVLLPANRVLQSAAE